MTHAIVQSAIQAAQLARTAADAALAKVATDTTGLTAAAAASVAAQQAQDAARQAEQAFLGGQADQAESLSAAALAAAGQAITSAAKVHGAADAADPVEEWKECRGSIDRFDKLLVELRKTGLGVVTAIVTAATFLLIRNPDLASTAPGRHAASIQEFARFAIFGIIILLALTLYHLDHLHQNFLEAAIGRARTLEDQIGYRITRQISASGESFSHGWSGTILYSIVIAASNLAFCAVQLATPPTKSLYQDCFFWTLLGGSIVGMALVWWMTTPRSGRAFRSTP